MRGWGEESIIIIIGKGTVGVRLIKKIIKNTRYRLSASPKWNFSHGEILMAQLNTQSYKMFVDHKKLLF
jgi:hypothetical protein